MSAPTPSGADAPPAPAPVEEPPPFLGTWPRVYALLIFTQALVITALALLSEVGE